MLVMRMPKEAWELLPLLKGFSRCRLCRLNAEKQEQIWQWLKEGLTYQQIAENLGVSHQMVYRHKRHMLRAFERYMQVMGEKASELKRLDIQLQVEREKRKQLELAREREERAKLVVDALKELVSKEKFERIMDILSEEGEGEAPAEPKQEGD